MPPAEFILLGDALWLDFVNTAFGREPSPPDLLTDSDAFARWSRLHHLDPSAEGQPFARVLELRARLSALAEAMCDERGPPAAAIASLNEQLAGSVGSRQLTRVSGEWRLRFAPARPLSTLEAIARSAAVTLADGRVTVRRCAGQTCTLLFTDDSQEERRLWCDADACGKFARIERRRGLRR
jgi:predicted RNA-binding Zn ribbon-like protein